MKRFHSNLQKVLDLCTQQSRMAELALARVQSLEASARQRVQVARQRLQQSHEEVNQALSRSRQLTMILGMHQHLAAAEERLVLLRKDLEQAEKATAQARLAYQEAHSKVERIEKLIEKQRADYRREMLLVQQQAMDDVAIFRWTPQDRQETEVNQHG